MKRKLMKPNDLGTNFMVDQCQRFDVSTYTRLSKSKLREAIMKSHMVAAGVKVGLVTSKVGKNGVRNWFKCPLCSKRFGVLFVHPITQILGCRVCLNLEYRKRRFKGMVENIIIN